MATITFKNKNVSTIGELPAIGSIMPEFHIVKSDLTELTSSDVRGKKVVFNIFPSIDTPICAMSVRKFNEVIDSLGNTVVICVSMDLPFALGRFCGAEGLNNVITASDFRSHEFGKNFGVRITSGPLAGLLSRAIVVADNNGRVIYTEQVADIGQEPDYSKVLAVLANK